MTVEAFLNLKAALWGSPNKKQSVCVCVCVCIDYHGSFERHTGHPDCRPAYSSRTPASCFRSLANSKKDSVSSRPPVAF